MAEKQFAVISRWYDYQAFEFIRSTPQQTVVKDSREVRVSSEKVKAVLPEAAARMLVERLNSSAALSRQEESAARVRHQTRAAKLIADALPSRNDNRKEVSP